MMTIARSILLASGSALAFAAPAFAQDVQSSTPAVEEQQSGLQDIIVTAQKRSENLQNVPIAVTALSSGELKSGNIDGQLTLPKLTPNLNFSIVATFAATYIRGVGTQYANPGLEPSVPVYFDDTYVPRAAAGVFNFIDLERIEVLKGPQGTLYGRNATGGAIRVITNDPKLGKFEGNADVTYGTDNRFKIGGVLNLPLGDNLAIRIAAQHDQNDGYLTNLAPNRPGSTANRNSEMYTAKILWEPTDALRIKISGDYSDKRDDEGMTFQNSFNAPQQVGLVFGGCGSTSFYTYCNDLVNAGDIVKAWGVTGRVDYDLGAATISSITGYRKETEDDTADLDGTGARLLSSHGVPFTRQFTQELQIASNNKGRLRYVAGAYFLTERASYVYNLFGAAIDGDPNYTALAAFLGVTGPLNVRAQGPGVKTTSFAPYVQADYDITDKLTVTAGVRYTIEKKSLLGYDQGFATNTGDGDVVPGTFVSGEGLAALGVPGLGGICTTPGQALCRTLPGRSLKFNKLTPKLTLSFKPNNDLLLYANISRGFKSGGFSLPAYAYVDGVEPEVLDDIDIGLKYQAGNIRFNAAAFFYNYKNLQVQITDPTNGTTFTRNGANAHNYGVEGDLSWYISNQFEVGAGGGLLSAKNTSFPQGNCYVPNYIAASCAGGPVHPAGVGAGAVGNSFLPADLEGYALVNAPRVTAYLRGQFTQPVDGVGTFRLSSIVNYRSVAYFDIANQSPDKERALLSARLQWTSESEKFSLAVYGENLGGVHYYLSNTIQAAGGFRVPAAPRQVYVTAAVKF